MRLLNKSLSRYLLIAAAKLRIVSVSASISMACVLFCFPSNFTECSWGEILKLMATKWKVAWRECKMWLLIQLVEFSFFSFNFIVENVKWGGREKEEWKKGGGEEKGKKNRGIVCKKMWFCRKSLG